YGLSLHRWECFRNSAFWITGAGTGFGRALAVALGSAGARVLLTGRRQSKLIESVAEAEEMGAPRANFFVLPADVTSEEQVLQTVRAIETSGVQLRGVINSAGVAQDRRSPWPLLDQTADSWREILGTNLLGSWLVTKSAVPLMVRG